MYFYILSIFFFSVCPPPPKWWIIQYNGVYCSKPITLLWMSDKVLCFPVYSLNHWCYKISVVLLLSLFKTFRIKPPMCITKEDVDFFMAVFDKSVHNYMERRWKPGKGQTDCSVLKRPWSARGDLFSIWIVKVSVLILITSLSLFLPLYSD